MTTNLCLTVLFLSFCVTNFSEASSDKKLIIRQVVPHARSSYQSAPSNDDANDYQASKYKKSSLPSSQNGAYESTSPYQSDPSHCASDVECEEVDMNAQCINNKCQCKSPFLTIDVGAAMLTKRASAYENHQASAVYLPPQQRILKCLPKFQLTSTSVTCLVQQGCCLTSDEQARQQANNPSCSVSADPAVLALYNNASGINPPQVTYTLVNASMNPGVSVDAATGAVTTNSALSAPGATVTVQVTLASNPPQMAAAQVMIQVLQDQCCSQAPAQLSPTVAINLDEIVADSFFLFTAPANYILVDFSGQSVPTFVGAALGNLFEGPCGKDVTLVNATLAPTMASTDFCQYLALTSGNELVFASDPNNPDLFVPQYYANVLSGALENTINTCAVTVNVAACNGNTLTATTTVQFTASSLSSMINFYNSFPNVVDDINADGKAAVQNAELTQHLMHFEKLMKTRQTSSEDFSIKVTKKKKSKKNRRN